MGVGLRNDESTGNMPIVEPVYTNYPPSSLFDTYDLKGNVERMFEKLTEKATFYIHIPFCESKCNYCHLLSSVPEGSKVVRKYVEALIKEIHLFSDNVKDRHFLVDVIYFGGGTPSFLSSGQIGRILSTIQDEFDLSKDCEITLECHPITLTKRKLQEFRDYGVNRLSVGIQSFDPEVLSACGRYNPYEKVTKIMRNAGNAGFENISLDIMFGLPHQTVSSIDKTCDQVVKLEPKQISVYVLTLSEKSSLYKNGPASCGFLPNEKVKSEMYDHIFQRLTGSEYRSYTANNFTTETKYLSRYMANNWRSDVDRIGFGLGSYAFCNLYQYENCTDIGEYASSLKKNKLPIAHGVHLSRNEQIRRRMVFMLHNLVVPRIIAGQNIDSIFDRALRKLELEGLVDRSPKAIKLTYNGIKYLYYVQREFFSNQVVAALNRLKALK